MLPLALAASVFSFIAIFYSDIKNIDWNKTPYVTVTKTDFINHYLFQSTFSQRPLYASREHSDNYGLITNYEFDSEGLFIRADARELLTLDNIPPFPLEDLLNDIEKPNSFQTDIGWKNDLIKNILTALIPWLIIIPALFCRRKPLLHY